MVLVLLAGSAAAQDKWTPEDEMEMQFLEDLWIEGFGLPGPLSPSEPHELIMYDSDGEFAFEGGAAIDMDGTANDKEDTQYWPRSRETTPWTHDTWSGPTNGDWEKLDPSASVSSQNNTAEANCKAYWHAYEAMGGSQGTTPLFYFGTEAEAKVEVDLVAGDFATGQAIAMSCCKGEGTYTYDRNDQTNTYVRLEGTLRFEVDLDTVTGPDKLIDGPDYLFAQLVYDNDGDPVGSYAYATWDPTYTDPTLGQVGKWSIVYFECDHNPTTHENTVGSFQTDSALEYDGIDQWTCDFDFEMAHDDSFDVEVDSNCSGSEEEANISMNNYTGATSGTQWLRIGARILGSVSSTR
jgi:hypothetical protein